MREVAPITVSCFEKEWVEQHAEPLYFWKRVNGTRVKLESGYYILNVGHEKYYDEKMGLKMEDVEATDYMIQSEKCVDEIDKILALNYN